MLRTALLATALALGACATQETAQTTPSADRDCFNSTMVSGYSYIDERHIGVTVGANRHYVLTTMFNARDLDWTHAIALRSTSNWICTGNGIGVEIIGGEPQRTYPINGVARAPEATPPEQGS